MRPFLVLLLMLVFLGTVATYAWISNWLKPASPVHATQQADGDYSLKIQISFDQTVDSQDNLKVLLNGTRVFTTKNRIPSSEVIELQDLPVRLGKNRLHVSLNTPSFTYHQRVKTAESFLLDEPLKATNNGFRCCRVQIFHNGGRLPGGDFTVHADGKPQIIVDATFNVADSQSHPHSH
ncbi:MAG: hypothetical protein VX438_15030 [Planctomycetota bacterium]|nr:hypothetical protein [Planctomycetota bacterium]